MPIPMKFYEIECYKCLGSRMKKLSLQFSKHTDIIFRIRN